jgi:NTE family protein
VTVATTGIETGEVVLFDTAHGKLTLEHLMANCGMPPEFAPVTIGGRLLGDGGLAVNAPFEPLLKDVEDRAIFVLDLFSRDGGRPRSLAAAVARKNELMFGNQSLRLLEFWRDAIASTSDRKQVVYVSYRAPPNEADAEKMFDFATRTIEDRWKIGARDMELAFQLMSSRSSDRLLHVRAAAASSDERQLVPAPAVASK